MPNIGDRYEISPGLVYEYISNKFDVVIVSSDDPALLGLTRNWSPWVDEYLGNYAKDTSLITLYDILNENS